MGKLFWGIIDSMEDVVGLPMIVQKKFNEDTDFGRLKDLWYCSIIGSSKGKLYSITCLKFSFQIWGSSVKVLDI